MLFVLLDLLWGQAGKVFAVHRGTAEEERTADDVVDLTISIPQSPVGSQVHQLALVIANQSNVIIEGIDRLNVATYDLLHSFQGIVDLPHLWPVLRFNYQDTHSNTFFL